MSYLTLRSSYIYFTLHSITFISYIWPFGDSHYADVALGENEFDTPALCLCYTLLKVLHKIISDS